MTMPLVMIRDTAVDCCADNDASSVGAASIAARATAARRMAMQSELYVNRQLRVSSDTVLQLVDHPLVHECLAELRDARTGAEVASLQQSGVHFDQDRRRPTPLPEELRARALASLIA